MKKTFTLLTLLIFISLSSNAQWTELVKKVASNGAVHDNFGHSSAIDGDRMVAGATQDDPNGINSGSANIFSKDNGGADTWGEVKNVFPSSGADHDSFGFSSSISGDYALIGCVLCDVDGNANEGAAYIFQKDQGGIDNWGELVKLTSSDGAANDEFGHSVAIRGDYAVVGARHSDPSGNASQGAAYIFQKDQGGTNNWGQLKKITSSDGETGDVFGSSVAISGDYIIVGALGEGMNDIGAAYIFKKDQGGTNNWGEIKKITHPTPTMGDNFGSGVSINGSYAVIGAPGDAPNGSILVFKQNQGGSDNWGHVATSTASDGTSSDQFGRSVDIDDQNILVGAVTASGGGAAYFFQKNQGGTDNWGQLIKVTASDLMSGDGFGQSVGISGEYAVIGSYKDHIGSNEDQGSAYVFKNPNALPVELINFQASQKDNANFLTWETISETNNNGFEIEYSQNANDWRNIGSVNGNGNSNKLQTYSFYHDNPESGINYYRLRQIDFDGNFEYSNIVSVDVRNELSTPTISIFPNPNNGQFQIQLHNPNEQPYHVQLFDYKGVVIVDQLLENDYFELETILPKGVYWVKAQFHGEVLMEKVVVH